MGSETAKHLVLNLKKKTVESHRISFFLWSSLLIVNIWDAFEPFDPIKIKKEIVIKFCYGKNLFPNFFLNKIGYVFLSSVTWIQKLNNDKKTENQWKIDHSTRS